MTEPVTLSSEQARDLLRSNPDAYATPDRLRDLVRQLDINSPGSVTVLYSGQIVDGRLNASDIISGMRVAGEDIRVIDRTEAARFLMSPELQSAVADAFGIPPSELENRNYQGPAKDFLYDGRNGLWAETSGRFVDQTSGSILTISSGATPDRVLSATEIPHALSAPNVSDIDGVPIATLRARVATYGDSAAFEMIVARSYENVSNLRIALDDTGLPLKASNGQLLVDSRAFLADTPGVVAQAPNFIERTQALGPLLDPPNVYVTAGRAHLVDVTPKLTAAQIVVAPRSGIPDATPAVQPAATADVVPPQSVAIDPPSPSRAAAMPSDTPSQLAENSPGSARATALAEVPSRSSLAMLDPASPMPETARVAPRAMDVAEVSPPRSAAITPDTTPRVVPEVTPLRTSTAAPDTQPARSTAAGAPDIPPTSRIGPFTSQIEVGGRPGIGVVNEPHGPRLSVRSGIAQFGGPILRVAEVGHDVASTIHEAGNLTAEGNAVGVESTFVHFGSRTLGLAGGAALGTGVGLLLGVESGPGMLLTGTIGGVVGLVAGDKIAEWYDNNRIYNQEYDGHRWTMDPKHPEQGWQRSDIARDVNPETGASVDREINVVAGPDLTRRLDFMASNVSVGLILKNLPPASDPFTQPAGPSDERSAFPAPWHRDAQTGVWRREVVDDVLEHNYRITHFAEADPRRAAELDAAAEAVAARNALQSPAAIAARYERAYVSAGWGEFEPMPDQVMSASSNSGKLRASDGNTYQRGRDGEWISDGYLFDSRARSNVRDELDVTYAYQLADLSRLPTPVPPTPDTPRDNMRETLQAMYQLAGVSVTPGQLEAATTAVERTHASEGISGSFTFKLEPDPRTGAISANSAITTAQENAGGIYVDRSTTSAQDIRNVMQPVVSSSGPATTVGQITASTRAEANDTSETARLSIERLSPQQRAIADETIACAQRSGLDTAQTYNAALAMVAAAGSNGVKRPDRMAEVEGTLHASFHPYGDREPIFNAAINLQHAAATPPEESLSLIDQNEKRQILAQQPSLISQDEPGLTMRRA